MQFARQGSLKLLSGRPLLAGGLRIGFDQLWWFNSEAAGAPTLHDRGGRSNVISVEHTTLMNHCPCEGNLHAWPHIFNRK